MPGLGGKSVGRVTIRVLPDATKFRDDLLASLRRIEKTVTGTIKVDADVSGLERSLKRIQDRWNGESVTLNADVDGGAAATRLAALTRPRTVAISAAMVPGSIAKVGSALAALSGGRVLGDAASGVARSLGNLDRSLPKIAALATSIASLATLALSAGGGLATLAASLSSVLAVAAVAPALIAGAGVSIAVLAVALSQIGDRLPGVIDRWKSLGDVIGDNFWGEATRPLRELSDSIFPGIREGLAGTASALGSWTASLAQGFQAALTGAALEQMFGRLRESIDIAATGTGSFASALVALGLVGSDYLPRLAQYIANLTTRFDGFVNAAASDGRLKGWIDAGIVAAQQLGSTIASLVSIVGSVANAAQAAGGGGLATLAETLSSIATAIASTGAQQTLTTLFAGAAAGASGLASALGPIASMFGTLAPILANIMSGVGSGIGALFSQIAQALSLPAFQLGLADFFAGILDGISALGPALPALAEALGSVGSFAGELGAQLGSVLAAGFQALAPVITSVLDALTPLLPVLGDALIGILQMLGPVLVNVATTLLPPLVDALAQIIPTLLPLVEQILPSLVALLPTVAALFAALAPLIVPFVQVLTLVASIISSILVPALDMLTPAIEIMVASMTTAASFMGGILKTALLLVSGLLSGDLSGSLNAIGALWAEVWEGIIAMQAKVGAAIGQFVSKLLQSFGVAQSSAESVGSAISGFFASLAGGVQAAVEGAVAGISNLVNGAISIVRGAVATINGLFGGISAPDVTVRRGGGGSFGDPPELARGAVVLPQPGGTLVRLAEAGRSEAVVDEGLLNEQLARANARYSQQSTGPMTVWVQSPFGDGEYFEAKVESISRSTTAKDARRAKALSGPSPRR